MIGLWEITGELCRLLEERCGAAAFAQRMEGAVYPALLVTAEDSAAPLSGGQIQREVQVEVLCLPSRQRERTEGQRLAQKAAEAVLPGITVCGRQFCPRKVESRLDGQERYRVRFELSFCDRPEEKSQGEEGPRMERLHLKVRKKEDGYGNAADPDSI